MSKKQKVDSNIIKLKDVRLSFPQLFTPVAFEEGKPPRYQAAFLLDPSDKFHVKQIKEIKTEAKRIMEESWGEVPPKDEYRSCFGLADKHPKKRQYDGYKGMFYIDTANTIAPTLIDRRKQEVIEQDGVLYAGCYVNTNVTLWAYDHPKGGKGIGANLRIVQFYRDGEAFGQGKASVDEMDEVDIEDDEDETVDDWDDEDDL
jgi:hypothetical protein